MHAIREHNAGNWTVDAAHHLHALCGQPDFVAGCTNAAGLHLQSHIFALHRVGVVDASNSECGGEGLKSGAGAVLIDKRFRRPDHVAFWHPADRPCHQLPV
jgi:hypothetical protein